MLPVGAGGATVVKGIEGAGGGTGVFGADINDTEFDTVVFIGTFDSTGATVVEDETRLIIFDALILESEFKFAIKLEAVTVIAEFELLKAVCIKEIKDYLFLFLFTIFKKKIKELKLRNVQMQSEDQQYA